MGALGYLEIVGTLQIEIFEDTRVNYHATEEDLLAKTVYYVWTFMGAPIQVIYI